LLEPDGNGGERLWVAATYDGLGLLQNGRWRYFNANNGYLPHANVRSVQRVADESGALRLFIGVGEGELLRVQEASDISPFDPSAFQFERLQTPWPKGPGHAVMQVLSREFAGKPEMWVATRLSGIYRLRGGQWTAMQATGVANPWTIVRIAEQILPNGESWLWATTNQGLARYNGTQWQLLRNLKNLPESNLLGLSLRTDNNGTAVLWLGSARSGVVQVDVTAPLEPAVLSSNALPAAPDPSVYSALHDSQGRIYVCTNNGVQQLTPKPNGGFDERIFLRRDGLVHEECNTNAQLIDSHDRYWIGTMGGLSVYDPNVQSQIQKPRPKTLLLTAIRLDNRRVEFVQDAPSETPQRITIPADVRELRFSFALMTAQRETETRYRTQLIGYDDLPLPWGEHNFRSLGKPPPGVYTLQIEGRDYAGVVAKASLLTLQIIPAWWQRTGVQSFAALLVLLMIFAGVHWRLRKARAQQQLLQDQVNLRTLELNTANGRLTELSYLDALTGLANRRFFIDALNEYWEAAQAAQTPLAVIILDVDYFKAFNDQYGHLNGDQALRQVAEAMRTVAGKGIVIARYGGEEFACVIHPAELDLALAVAEQIRTSVESLVMHMPSGESTSITLSAGIAALIPTAALRPDDLLREADGALYLAKRTGRNRVCSADVGSL